VIRCNDLACSAPNIATPDAVPGDFPFNTSLVLDINSNPIISRFSSSINSLTVVRCTDPMCVPHVKVLSAP
jgi:hypothetical protein